MDELLNEAAAMLKLAMEGAASPGDVWTEEASGFELYRPSEVGEDETRELSETKIPAEGSREGAVSPEKLSHIFERDARRYDGGGV